jgi:hypothetical protein
VFQLLFSNKSTSRAIKNLAAFFSDVTHSPVTPRNEKERKNKQEYITENILSIRNISPQGKTTDIKQYLLDDFTSEKWKEWENRLARPSIKARMDDVNAAYENIIEEEFENNHAIL